MEIIIPTDKKQLSDEETSKMMISILKKILNGNKQLVSVSGVMKNGSQIPENKENLEKSLNQLSQTTNIMQEDIRAASTTKNYKYVKNLISRVSEYVELTEKVINFDVLIAMENETMDLGIFKKVKKKKVSFPPNKNIQLKI